MTPPPPSLLHRHPLFLAKILKIQYLLVSMTHNQDASKMMGGKIMLCWHFSQIFRVKFNFP